MSERGRLFMTTKRWTNTQCFERANEPCSSPLARLLGFHGPLITVFRAYSGKEKGGGEEKARGSAGHVEKEMTPSCRLFRCKEKQARAGEHALTRGSVTLSTAASWCVNITGSINLTVHLSLATCVHVSLAGAGQGSFWCLGRNKLLQKK